MRVLIKMQKNELRVNFYTRVLNTKLSETPKIRYGSTTCAYADTATLNAEVNVSGFTSYIILATFRGENEGYDTHKPMLFIKNNIIAIRRSNGSTDFNANSTISVNYAIIGL